MKTLTKRLCKRKVLIPFLSVIALLAFVVPLSADGKSDLESVSHLYDMMILDEMFTYWVKAIGHFIYSGLSGLLTMVESGFTQLAKFDLFGAIPQLKTIRDNLELMIGTLFILGFSAVILMRMFSMKETVSVLYNALIVGMVLVIFSGLITLANDGRIAFTNAVTTAVGDGATTSERMYIENTYDLKFLIEKAQNGEKVIVNLKDQGITSDTLQYLRWDERLTKADFGYKYQLNSSTGALEAVRVHDGKFGIGDERYMRFYTSYARLNTALAVSVIVFVIAFIKMGHLLVDLVWNELLGKIGTVKGLSDVSHAIKPVLTFTQTIVSILILIVLTMTYSSIASGILSISDATLPWFAKIVIMLGFGMTILFGSDFLDSVFGFEGARRTLMSSFMLARGANYARKKAWSGAKKLGGATKDKAKDLINKGDELNGNPNTPNGNDDNSGGSGGENKTPETIDESKVNEQDDKNWSVVDDASYQVASIPSEDSVNKDSSHSDTKKNHEQSNKTVTSNKADHTPETNLSEKGNAIDGLNNADQNNHHHAQTVPTDEDVANHIVENSPQMEDWEMDERNLYESNLQEHDRKYGGLKTREEKKARYEAEKRSSTQNIKTEHPKVSKQSSSSYERERELLSNKKVKTERVQPTYSQAEIDNLDDQDFNNWYIDNFVDVFKEKGGDD